MRSTGTWSRRFRLVVSAGVAAFILVAFVPHGVVGAFVSASDEESITSDPDPSVELVRPAESLTDIPFIARALLVPPVSVLFHLEPPLVSSRIALVIRLLSPRAPPSPAR